jgi:hypothetical protein
MVYMNFFVRLRGHLLGIDSHECVRCCQSVYDEGRFGMQMCRGRAMTALGVRASGASENAHDWAEAGANAGSGCSGFKVFFG